MTRTKAERAASALFRNADLPHLNKGADFMCETVKSQYRLNVLRDADCGDVSDAAEAFRKIIKRIGNGIVAIQLDENGNQVITWKDQGVVHTLDHVKYGLMYMDLDAIVRVLHAYGKAVELYTYRTYIMD